MLIFILYLANEIIEVQLSLMMGKTPPLNIERVTSAVGLLITRRRGVYELAIYR